MPFPRTCEGGLRMRTCDLSTQMKAAVLVLVSRGRRRAARDPERTATPPPQGSVRPEGPAARPATQPQGRWLWTLPMP